MRIIILPSPYPLYRNINGLIWQALASLALISHARTMFTDPGAVPKGNATKEMIQQMGFRQGQVIYKCQKCCSIKPERAHHCSVCQRYFEQQQNFACNDRLNLINFSSQGAYEKWIITGRHSCC